MPRFYFRSLQKPIAASKPDKGKQKNSNKISQQREAADVQINLEQKKSGSDLSSKSMPRSKCWQQTHKTFEVVNRCDDRKYDDDHQSIVFDEMTFEGIPLFAFKFWLLISSFFKQQHTSSNNLRLVLKIFSLCTAFLIAKCLKSNYEYQIIRF